MIDLVAAAIRSRPPIRTIDDVIAVMRAIDGLLADDDGLKWFNFLYLRVTESVRDHPPATGWEDARWLTRLDVVFANLYFEALAGNPARAWRPLLDSRRRRDVARIQFALAGMNAHINHDLAIALVRTSEELGVEPERDTPQHRDYERVNTLLEIVEAEVKRVLLTGHLGAIDRHFGRVDDVIALWKVSAARDTAWTNGELLWELRRVDRLRDKFLTNLDRLAGLATKGLLAPAL